MSSFDSITPSQSVSNHTSKHSILKKSIWVWITTVLLWYWIYNKIGTDKNKSQAIRQSDNVTINEITDKKIKIWERNIIPIRQKSSNSCAQATLRSIIVSITGNDISEEEVSNQLWKDLWSNSYTPEVGLIATILNKYFTSSLSHYSAKVHRFMDEDALENLLINQKKLIIVPYYSPIWDVHYWQVVWDGKQITIISSGWVLKLQWDNVNFCEYNIHRNDLIIWNFPTIQKMSRKDFMTLRNNALVWYSWLLHSLTSLVIDLPVIVVEKLYVVKD